MRPTPRGYRIKNRGSIDEFSSGMLVIVGVVGDGLIYRHNRVSIATTRLSNSIADRYRSSVAADPLEATRCAAVF